MASEETKKTKKANGTLRLLKILKYFEEETDEQHPVTINELVKVVEGWGMHAERHTLKKDIEALMEEDYDLIEEGGSPKKYYLASRTFEDAELRLLIDAVACARFVSDKKRKELTGKLQTMSNRHQREKLKRHIYAPGVANRNAINIVDILNTAIEKKQKVTFHLYAYYLDKDNFKYRTYPDGNPRNYYVSPYTLLWDDGFYYLLGGMYSKSEQKVKIFSFRVDRIDLSSLKQLEEPRKEAPDDFREEDYAGKYYHMFPGGQIQDVKLRCGAEMLPYVRDIFGEAILSTLQHYASTDEYVVTVQVSPSATFFGWLAGFQGKIRIVDSENDAVQKEYEAFLEKTLKEQKQTE